MHFRNTSKIEESENVKAVTADIYNTTELVRNPKKEMTR